MNKRAFTLIELLIVVAIIGVLAAIAVPNFLNAQIRAQIARATSDHKSIGDSLEMYLLDHNAYPGDHDLDNFMNGEAGLFRLTTPVSYMSSLPSDPFIERNLMNYISQSSNGYAKQGRPDYEMGSGSDNTGQYRIHAWSLLSYGPDRDDDIGPHDSFPFGVWIKPYDATNGLRANGDLSRIGGNWMRGCVTFGMGAGAKRKGGGCQ